MATMPAEPGGSAAPIFSSRPLSTRCRANLPIRAPAAPPATADASSGGASSRSEEHTSELQSPCNHVCRLLLAKKKSEAITDLIRQGSKDARLRAATVEYP